MLVLNNSNNQYQEEEETEQQRQTFDGKKKKKKKKKKRRKSSLFVWFENNFLVFSEMILVTLGLHHCFRSRDILRDFREIFFFFKWSPLVCYTRIKLTKIQSRPNNHFTDVNIMDFQLHNFHSGHVIMSLSHCSRQFSCWCGFMHIN